jgi:hypothetical protein
LVDAAAEEACLVCRLCGLVVGGTRTKGVTALVGSCSRGAEGFERQIYSRIIVIFIPCLSEFG